MKGRASTELLWRCALWCRHSSSDSSSPSTQINKTHQCLVWRPQRVSWADIYLKKIRNNFFVSVFFKLLLLYLKKNGKKDNHPAVCMTQKHQLKTIPCITYYFMLGWNLSACINSLYKLRLVDWRRPLCVGTSVWLCF